MPTHVQESINSTGSTRIAGAVLIVGSGPVISEDASKLFWDNSNNRLGIGTNSPIRDLDIRGTMTVIDAEQSDEGSAFVNLVTGSGNGSITIGRNSNALGRLIFNNGTTSKWIFGMVAMGSDTLTLSSASVDILSITQSGNVSLKSGGSSSFASIGGVIFNNFTDITTTHTDGTEDDLYSYTIAASTLAVNGDSIHEREHVQFVSSATAARRLKKYFAGTLIFDSGALTLTLGGDFFIETMVIRESSSIVRVSVNVVTTSASSIPYATYTRITSLTLTNTQVLKTTGSASGTGAASGDILNKLSKVKWESAA